MAAGSQTRQSIIDAACFLAGQEGIDKDVVGDILLPRIIYLVTKQAAADPNRRQLTMRLHSMAVVSGTVVLPTTVLVEFIKYAAIEDTSGSPPLNKRYRFVADWREYIRPLDPSLGYFTVRQLANVNQFYLSQPGAAPATSTVTVTLTTPTVPAVPAAASDSLTCNEELTDEMIVTLAAALKGGWAEAVRKQEAKIA